MLKLPEKSEQVSYRSVCSIDFHRTEYLILQCTLRCYVCLALIHHDLLQRTTDVIILLLRDSAYFVVEVVFGPVNGQ